VLSVAPLAQGPGYYLELANINYYADGGEPLPTWHGTAARELGLSGIAQREHVERLCSGFHHETQEALVRNAGTTEGDKRRNPGHDLTFSAPKSVSVAWAIADPALRKAIQIKHEEAVKQALDFIESKAGFARVGKQGQEVVKAPLLFALFEHGTSRAGDPQLHTHALCINLTMHPNGRVTAIDSTHLYHWKMAGGAMYRAALARGMQELGLAVEQRRVGASIGFELKEIPKDIIEECSKRRAEIELKLNLNAGGLDTASPKYAEMVAKETRRAKDTEKPRKELFEEWQALGREFGIDGDYLYATRVPLGVITPEMRAERRELISREAIEALSEQNAHWNEVAFTKAIAERSAGRITAQDAQRLVEQKLSSSEMVCLGRLTTEKQNQGQNRYVERGEFRYSTAEIKRLEQRMLENVERVVQGPESGSSPERIEEALKGPRPLDTEQKEAVQWLCSGPSIRLLSGIAGAGKTWTLQTCHELWQKEGREVIGCAIAAAAAERLQDGTGIESGTLDKLLGQLDRGKRELNSNTVIVLDEAGMVGNQHMARLIEYIAQTPGARLVLIGDAKQLQPILAGGPFKYLAELLGEAKLTVIRRQDAEWSREAVRDFEAGRSEKAIATFIENGHFHLAENRTQAMAEIIDQWKADGGIKEPSRVFLIANLNCEVKELNLRAQAERIRSGEVDPEKKLFANGFLFHEGDRLQFLKNSTELGVSNANTGTVLKVEPERERLFVRLDKDDQEIAVSLKRYPPEHIQLGYAGTTHKAQGATLPHVHVLMGGVLTDQHMGYVQASRSQLSTHLFTDKHTAGEGLKELIQDLGRSRQKTMAQEVTDRAQQHEPQHRHDPRPSLGPSLGL
jgi:conjugative relaxase-like TrwC/TraI family protein